MPFLHIDCDTFEFIRRYYVDKAFIGAVACNPTYGVTTTDEIDAKIKHSMWEHSETSYLLVDHTKFTSKSLLRYNEISDYDFILTDEELDDEMIKTIKESKGNLIIS